VITPNNDEIYYVNNIDLVSGGKLDGDRNPESSEGLGLWAENVYFPSSGSAPKGEYRFFVRNFFGLGSEREIWLLEVSVNRTIISSYIGTTPYNLDSPTFVYMKN
jgi:hypothetical protein